MASENKGKNFLVGAVFGSVLGAVTALLFAPKSGRELRTDLAEGYQQVSEKSQQVAGEVGERTKQLAITVSDKTSATAKTIGRQTSEWAGRAKNLAVVAGNEVKSWRKDSDASEAVHAPVAATTTELEAEADSLEEAVSDKMTV